MNKNYTLINEKYLEEIKSNFRYYKHNKSGARVLFVKNSDENKVFSIGFRTPPKDSTGVPHILEHSVLCGSKKFPVKDPFVELLKGSLNTFLNAMTWPDKTCYPVASCNNKDFNNLMDIYLDATLNPNVYVHEEIFKQEGWHYELENKDDELKYNGVVYNEMKGAYSSSESYIMREVNHALYPDNTYGVDSGGDPDYIPSLTYKKFLEFHSKYYSPSNSYIVIYGDVDENEKLDFLDKEYLSKFDIVDPDSEIKMQTPFKERKYTSLYYPIGKDEDTKDKNYYVLGLCMGDYKDANTIYALNILTYILLDSSAAILKQALLDANIGKDVYSMFDDGCLQPSLQIVAKDAREGARDEFVNVINDTLKQIVKDGIDKKTLLAAINHYEFRIREADRGREPAGLYTIFDIMGSWLFDENDYSSRLEYNSIFAFLKEKVNSSYYEELIQKYFINNNHAAILEARPSKTLAEEKENKVKEILANKKASMSDEEIQCLISETKSLKEYQSTPSTLEELKTIPLLTRDDIKRSVSSMSNIEKEVDGVKVIRHDYQSNGVSYLSLYFKSDNVDPNDYPLIGLLNNCLGDVDTANYSYSDLDLEIDIYSGGVGFSTSSYNDKDDVDSYHFFATAGVKYLENDSKKAISLLEEILVRSDFSNKKRMKEILSEILSQSEYSLLGAGHRTAINRALSTLNKAASRADKESGLFAYHYLKDLNKNFDNEFDNLVLRLNNLLKTLYRKENLIISYTSSNDIDEESLTNLIENLFKDDVKVFEYDFAAKPTSIGLKAPSQVQYVALVGKFDNKKYNGAFAPFMQALSYDYLWVQGRVLGGAYGMFGDITRAGTLLFSSYRDPHIKNSLKIYEGVKDFIDQYNPSEEELTKSVIGAIGAIDTPMSSRGKGQAAMMCYLKNISDEERQKYRNEIIDADLNIIKTIKSVVEEALNNKTICVIGNENKIEENKEIFEEVSSLL